MDAETRAYLALLRGARLRRAERLLPRLRAQLAARGIDEWRGVTPAHLRAFVVSLEGLRPWTVYAYASAVRRFFAFLFLGGRILVDPSRELLLRTPRRLARPVPSEHEVRRLVASSSLLTPLALRDRAVLELLYGTGIRCGECVWLDLADVDLRGRRLFVRRGKGGRDRLLPLVGRARASLDAYLGGAREALARKLGEAALFLSFRGERLRGEGVRGVLERARVASGGVKLTPHLLRHACATHLLAGGADIRHVQVLLGHRSIETTALYTRVEPSILRRAIAQAHPLGAERLGRSGWSQRPSTTSIPASTSSSSARVTVPARSSKRARSTAMI